LDLKLSLNVISLDVSEPLADERGEDSDGGDDEGEVDGVSSLNHCLGGSRDDEGGAGGLSEGTEKIGTHTGDITNVVTDVVSDSAGVLGGVLGEGSIDFTSEIGTDISGLGVDTTTDSAEEGNGGATETVSRDELEEVLTFNNSSRLKGSLVGEDEDLEDEEGKTNEDKSEDLTTLEGDLESVVLLNVAKVSCLVVCNGGDDHADVTTKHGGGGSNDEGERGEGEGLVTFGPWHINGAEDDDREECAESGESKVFFSQEGDGAILDILVDLFHACFATFLVPRHHVDKLSVSFFIVRVGLLGVDLDFGSIELDLVDEEGVDTTPSETDDGTTDDNVMRVCTLNKFL